MIYSYRFEWWYELEIVYQCPLKDCKSLFIAYYMYDGDLEPDEGYKLNHIVPDKPSRREFGVSINNISSNFVRIFEQSQYAENLDLDAIVGPGYRKALEFLIKDYAIIRNPDFAESIKSMFLAKVINDFVADGKIKSTAKRAAWLGNDETHYVRKWEDKDIADLKRLINLTAQWIESEELTRQYEEEMKD